MHGDEENFKSFPVKDIDFDCACVIRLKYRRIRAFRKLGKINIRNEINERKDLVANVLTCHLL